MSAAFSTEQLIRASACWDVYWGRVCGLPDHKVQGDTFERLTQLYLQTAPEYRTKLRCVWKLDEVPASVAQRLNLPSRDEGVDLVAKTVEGEFWAIQCKFRSNSDKPLTRRDLATFTALAFGHCKHIALAVVAHTSTKPIGKRHLMGQPAETALPRAITVAKAVGARLQ